MGSLGDDSRRVRHSPFGPLHLAAAPPADAARESGNTHALVELASPFNLQLFQDRKIAEFWVEGAHLYPNYDAVDQYSYKSLLVWWLLLHENIYLQKRNRMLDDTVYESWQHDLRHFARHKLKDRWSELKPSFQKDFAEHVSELIATGAP